MQCIFRTTATIQLEGIKSKSTFIVLNIKKFYYLFSRFFLILLSLFITSHSRGTCASVEIMKGYMFRERLGTTALSHIRVKISGICYFKHQSKR